MSAPTCANCTFLKPRRAEHLHYADGDCMIALPFEINPYSRIRTAAAQHTCDLHEYRGYDPKGPSR